MSFFRRAHPSPDDLDTDEENDTTIDPELRLRTVRTAASAIAESIQTEQRAERRKRKGSRFFHRKNADEKRKAERPQTAESVAPPVEVPGIRRNVYVNYPLSAMEVDHNGEPLAHYVRNKVRTSSEYRM